MEKARGIALLLLLAYITDNIMQTIAPDRKLHNLEDMLLACTFADTKVPPSDLIALKSWSTARVHRPEGL